MSLIRVIVMWCFVLKSGRTYMYTTYNMTITVRYLRHSVQGCVDNSSRCSDLMTLWVGLYFAHRA